MPTKKLLSYSVSRKSTNSYHMENESRELQTAIRADQAAGAITRKKFGELSQPDSCAI